MNKGDEMIRGYNKAYQRAVNRLEEIYNKNVDKLSSDELKKRLRKIYREENLDPDGFYLDRNYKYKVKADGIISLKRLVDMEDNIIDVIEGYKKYRKYPIISFPSEVKGINTSRSHSGQLKDGVLTGGFGDRIDHTLFDLFLYYIDYDKCRLKETYNRPKTNEWLNSFGKGFAGFQNLIDHFKIRGIFTDNDYHVYDLSKDNSILEEENKIYSYKWDLSYYKNVKSKIEIYNKTKETQK